MVLDSGWAVAFKTAARHDWWSPVSTLSAIQPIVNTLRRLGRRLDLTVVVAVLVIGPGCWAAWWIEPLAARSTLDLSGVTGAFVVGDGLIDLPQDRFEVGAQFD
jgi:hypothetical protein